MNKTNIEYLDYSWNPIAMRCTPISEGCANCWHIKMADRMKNNPTLPAGRRDSYSGGPPVLIENELQAPLKRKKPAIIGTQFMGDLFHEDIGYAHIQEVFSIIELCSWHTFLVLTKRQMRMGNAIKTWFGNILPNNLWLGITAENQSRWNQRRFFQSIPAAKHFISLEPLLNNIDLKLRDNEIDWVIAGCESGPNRRQAKTQWFRDLKDQCLDAGVPFFLKQWEYEGFQKGYSVLEKMPYLDGRQWNAMPKLSRIT